jgi:hypothetical protein
LRVHGHEFVGLQISKTGDAAQIGLDTAIRRLMPYHALKIGVASLHGDEAALLWTTQIANVVGYGLNVPNPFGTIHYHHFNLFICVSYTISKYFIFVEIISFYELLFLDTLKRA